MKAGWEVKALGDVCDFKGGSQPPKSQFINEPRKGYIRMLQIRDFKSDSKAVYIPVTNKTNACEVTDIMIGRYGASVGQIHRGKSGAYNVALIRTIPNLAKVDPDYLYHFLTSDLFQKPLAVVSKRGAQDGFSKPDIAPFAIPLPPLDEQKRIVAVLDAAFEGLTRARTHVQTNLQNARELFASNVNSLFQVAKAENASRPIGELSHTITKGSSPKWQGVDYVDEPGVLFVTSENVGTNKLLFAKTKYVDEVFNTKDKKSILARGDVLTNIVGASIGRTAVFERDDIANINQAVCLIRCDGSLLNNYYLCYLLNSPFFKEKLHEAEVDNARANLSLTFFRNFVIPLPDATTQRAIVSKIDIFRLETDKLEVAFQQKLQDLDDLRQSLLQKAFAGELT